MTWPEWAIGAAGGVFCVWGALEALEAGNVTGVWGAFFGVLALLGMGVCIAMERRD